MENYFHIDHARKICIRVYLNLQTESQKYAKPCNIMRKNTCSHVFHGHCSVRPVLCEEHCYHRQPKLSYNMASNYKGFYGTFYKISLEVVKS